jgi:hypothetical protein
MTPFGWLVVMLWTSRPVDESIDGSTDLIYSRELSVAYVGSVGWFGISGPRGHKTRGDTGK